MTESAGQELASSPSVSVILTRAGPRGTLERTLEILAGWLPPGGLEVVIVTSGPTNVGSIAPVFPPPLAVRVVSDGAGLGEVAAFNRGAREASGRVLLFIPPAIIPLPSTLRCHYELHAGDRLNVEALLVVGAAMPGDAAGTEGESEANRNWRDRQLEQAFKPGHRLRYDGLLSGVVSMSARLFSSLGGFDESFQDRSVAELGIRVLNLGGRVSFSRMAGGLRRDARGLTGLVNRREREGRADVRLADRYPELWDRLRLSRAGTDHRARRLLRGLAFHTRWLSGAVLRLGAMALRFLERRHRPRAWHSFRNVIDYHAYWRGIAIELGGGRRALRALEVLATKAEAALQRDHDQAIEIDMTPAQVLPPSVSARPTRPRFTVVIPAFNAADTIGATLESVLAQTEPRWEAIVVDDGSSDETAAVAATWAGRHPRIRVIRRANAGPA